MSLELQSSLGFAGGSFFAALPEGRLRCLALRIALALPCHSICHQLQLPLGITVVCV